MKLVSVGLRILLILLGLLCVLSVLFALTASDSWWMRAFDYPRVQITIASVIVLVGSLFLLPRRNRWIQLFLLLQFLAVIYQGYILYPYLLPVTPTVVDNRAAASEQTFSVLAANVLMENREVESYLAIVESRNPDIVLVLEADDWWTEQLAPLRETYREHVEQPQSNHYGMNLYSKFPLSETQIHYYEHTGTPAIETVITLPSGDEVLFFGVHPRPPLPENSVKAADKELLQIAEHVKEVNRPTIVTGDFNDVPWAFTIREFRKISGFNDLRVGRGLYNTFDTKSWWLRFPIDHFYLSPKLELVEFADPITFSSDHKALFVRLAVSSAVQE